MDGANPEIPLTSSQMGQLTDFLAEKGHYKSIVLRESANLGAVEVDLIDDEGKRTPTRLLFPAG